jgi:hypothetical protein
MKKHLLQKKNFLELNSHQMIEVLVKQAKLAYLKFFEIHYILSTQSTDVMDDLQVATKKFIDLFELFYQRFFDKVLTVEETRNLAQQILYHFTSEFNPALYEKRLIEELESFVHQHTSMGIRK